jgi:hypothetical protein
MPTRRNRTQSCDKTDSHRRLAHARSFLDVAELTADEDDPSLEYASVAASVAVLAGIASADAACCAELGKRSRSENHRDAEALLREIVPGGKRAATRLSQLLSLKDTAHYGLIAVSAAELKRSLRQARQLVEFAETIVQRSRG